MKKKKKGGLALGLLAIGVYTIAIWPSKPDKQIEGEEVNNRTRKPPVDISRKPDRQIHKQIIKTVPHKREVKENPLRKDPGFKLSQEVYDRNVRIEKEGYGKIPPVDLEETNPHKEYVLNALKDPKNNSGAVSVTGKREPFNQAQYITDPSPYINSAEPGRAFDAAQGGEGVMKLAREGKAGMDAKQNETVTLTARTEKNMPISFTAFDGGRFQNGLSFITLKADGSGYASAEFTPTSGVINQARIRAASPVASGTLQWTVYVDLPAEETTNTNN